LRPCRANITFRPLSAGCPDVAFVTLQTLCARGSSIPLVALVPLRADRSNGDIKRVVVFGAGAIRDDDQVRAGNQVRWPLRDEHCRGAGEQLRKNRAAGTEQYCWHPPAVFSEKIEAFDRDARRRNIDAGVRDDDRLRVVIDLVGLSKSAKWQQSQNEHTAQNPSVISPHSNFSLPYVAETGRNRGHENFRWVKFRTIS
jgi:hypothetical protein